MKSQFRHVALVGKYHAQGSRLAVESIAQFLNAQGCDVAIEKDTASNTGLTQYPILDVAAIGNLVLRQFHGTGTNPTNYSGGYVDFTTATAGFTVSGMLPKAGGK